MAPYQPEQQLDDEDFDSGDRKTRGLRVLACTYEEDRYWNGIVLVAVESFCYTCKTRGGSGLLYALLSLTEHGLVRSHCV